MQMCVSKSERPGLPKHTFGVCGVGKQSSFGSGKMCLCFPDTMGEVLLNFDAPETGLNIDGFVGGDPSARWPWSRRSI